MIYSNYSKQKGEYVMKSKKAKIVISIIVAVVIIACVLPLANSLFGNPISKKFAKDAALEYIEKEYPDSDCVIKDVYYDSKYEDYVANIISSTDENIDLSLYISSKGEIKVIEHWKSKETYENSLSENEIKDLYNNAYKLYVEWLSPANNLVVDWENVTKIDDREYFIVDSTAITSVEALKTEFGKYFDRNSFDNIIEKYYVMHNGKLYGDAMLVEGGELPWENHKLTVKTNTDSECVFTITSTIDGESQDLDYRLKVVDGEWKFTGVFHFITTEVPVLK